MTARRVPDPAQVGLFRLAVAPGATTVADLSEALDGLPVGAVLMGGGLGPHAGELEFVEFGEPLPSTPALRDAARAELAAVLPLPVPSSAGGA